MNKIIFKSLLLIPVCFSIFDISFAQTIVMPYTLQIPSNVNSVISALATKYAFTAAQASALNQVARSYQYIFANPPSNKSEAYSLSIKDVASTNCASSRINGSSLDDAINKIEIASIDSANKKSMYDYYTSLLDENTPNPQILDSCEDKFSTGTETNNTTTENNFEIRLNGVVPDSDIKGGCLILTKFMEFGSSGSQVLSLQNFLMQNGYLEMYPTGFFGRNTEFAVKEWQKRHAVDVRGWAGPNTRGSIAGVTCKTQVAFDAAFRGVTSNTLTKKVLAVIPTTKPVMKTVVIATTTTTSTYLPLFLSKGTETNKNLTSTSGTFYVNRDIVNSLYFTYKANANVDDVFICIAKASASNCESAENFTKVKQKYEPGNMDFINNNTRWIFNIYYNIDIWSNVGGSIYLRNGIGNVSEVYTVKISESF